MVKFFKAFSSGISFALLYLFIVFVSPIVLLLLGYSDITSKPSLFGASLYSIEIEGQRFVSEATIFGFALALIGGLIIYFVSQLLVSSLRKTAA
ncbi:hypothetical protein [Halobacillus ihumii]|uniref:hypothetical protein n=1 Tax=Halobacillus ihumii TaxID=2686092 RepID=UPI0013D617B4|nr:hypothetical protein [Halobacillus ihumii]